MKSLTAVLFAVLLGFAHAAPPERVLVGQLLLPSGIGSRGVQILLTVVDEGNDPRVVWVLFDEQGRFTHDYHGVLTSVRVTAGVGADVHRVDTEDLPEVNQAGKIDLGEIDLRNRLTRHRLTVHEADRKPSGVVRVAMWFGLPPVGPQGEPVSLGSRQFPQVVLGSEAEWLLPNKGQSIYLLVERPVGPGRGRKWRSGQQKLFGPFTSADVPTELIMD
jgi:hypothetical protein